MAEITAALVKELREISGAGMMDCKKALGETSGDLNGAVDWLRKKGLAAAAKKAGRIAAEGLIGAVAAGPMGALVEVNAETDFVARNDQFQAFVAQATQLALKVGDIEALKAVNDPASGVPLATALTNLVAKIGENMTLRRMAKLSVKQGSVATYVHNAAAPNMGKIGVLVAIESAGDPAKLAALGKQIAMHVAATNPHSVTVAALDPALVDRERQVLSEQARATGKPEDVIAKMVEGRLRKFYEETVLLEQLYVIDGESRVKQVVEKAAKEMGTPITIAGFCRMALGEGIEREEKDFAAEVAAQLKS